MTRVRAGRVTNSGVDNSRHGDLESPSYSVKRPEEPALHRSLVWGGHHFRGAHSPSWILMKEGWLMATFSKKKKFLLVTAALLLTGGVAAAYWTTGGSGTGDAATGTSADSHRQPDQRASRTWVPGSRTAGPRRQLHQHRQPARSTSRSSRSSISASSRTRWRPVAGCDGRRLHARQQPADHRRRRCGRNDRRHLGRCDRIRCMFVNKPATNQDGCKNADGQPGLHDRLIELTSN